MSVVVSVIAGKLGGQRLELCLDKAQSPCFSGTRVDSFGRYFGACLADYHTVITGEHGLRCRLTTAGLHA